MTHLLHPHAVRRDGVWPEPSVGPCRAVGLRPRPLVLSPARATRATGQPRPGLAALFAGHLPRDARSRQAGEETTRTTDIIVGVDGTEQGRAAVRWAAREAARRGLPLRIVHVLDWHWSAA